MREPSADALELPLAAQIGLEFKRTPSTSRDASRLRLLPVTVTPDQPAGTTEASSAAGYVGLSQISGVDGSSGLTVNFALWFGGPMILSAIAEKLKRRSKDDFKGRHFQAS